MIIEYLSLKENGAVRASQAALAILTELIELTEKLPSNEAGIRLSKIEALDKLCLPKSTIGEVAARYLGPNNRPVRALLFNKSQSINWSIGWHQDRTICVETKSKVDGFGPWSIKKDMIHVEPPFEILSRMLTLRIHLDDVPNTNAPLKVALGSHLLGKVPQDKIEMSVADAQCLECTASAGDIWIYATPIIHASEIATQPSSRRVVQIDYSADELPDGLNWVGI